MTETPQNVLFVTVDSLRYDATEWFDVDGYLDDALSFDRAYATGPGTTPSFPGMLTGTMPLSYGGLGPLSADRPRLATNLRDAGLATSAFQCNPFLSTHFDYDTGFETFEDYQHPLMGVATRLFPRGIELNTPALAAVDDVLHLTDAIKWVYRLVAGKPRPYVSADVVTDDAVDWLAQADEPFFCWTHYMDVHHPCFPPAEYRDERGVAHVDQADVADWYSALVSAPEELTREDIDALERLYEAAIAFTGDQIQRLFTRLATDGRLDETLVVVTSDHGELFGDHDQYGKPERMYDELLHVPLWVDGGPDSLADTTDTLVSLLDLPPTIHDALGVPVPDAYEGRRLGVDDPREYVLAEHEVGGEVVVGARSPTCLYEADEIHGESRLFDCRDGFERVAADEPIPGSETVRNAVHERLSSLDIEASRPGEQVEDDVESRLENLGYLQ